MLTWFISGWLHLAIGLIIGWFVFPRPQWATDIWNKIKAKFGGS